MKAFSLEEALAYIAAVQAEVDSGASTPGSRDFGRPCAITLAARKLGVHSMTLRSRLAAGGPIERQHGITVDWKRPVGIVSAEADKRAAARGEHGFDPVLSGFEIESTATLQGATGETEKQWIKQKRERGEVFELPAGQVLKGVSALVDGNGREIAKWIKTREDDGTVDMVEALKAVFDAYKGLAPLTPPPAYTNTEILTVYPIADLHVGMYSWAPETGEDMDLKIIEELFLDRMQTLVAKASPSQTAVLLNLGDFFHADSRANRTEHSGAELDVDSRYARVLQVGIRLMIRCVELALQKHEHVILRNLPGNHDYHSSLALTAALGAFFHLEPRVTVDTDPSKFFVMPFGKTLITATHGDMAKPSAMPGIVAARWPKLWGDTTYRYCLTGHIHHRSMLASELNGMVCDTFQTIAAKDFWHASMGYCAGRSLVAITYHQNYGECDRVTASVPAPAEARMRMAA